MDAVSLLFSAACAWVDLKSALVADKNSAHVVSYSPRRGDTT
jgi:hypothetical protein